MHITSIMFKALHNFSICQSYRKIVLYRNLGLPSVTYYWCWKYFFYFFQYLFGFYYYEFRTFLHKNEFEWMTIFYDGWGFWQMMVPLLLSNLMGTKDNTKRNSSVSSLFLNICLYTLCPELQSQPYLLIRMNDESASTLCFTSFWTSTKSSTVF